MKNKSIPSDYTPYIRKQILRRVIPLLISEAVLGIILFLFGERMFAEGSETFQMTARIAVTVIPFICTGVPVKLIDKTFYGEVLDVKIKNTIGSTEMFAIHREVFKKITTTVIVRTSDGNIVEKVVYDYKPEEASEFDKYEAGDKVFHLYLSKYVVKVLPESKNRSRCPVCGAINSQNGGECDTCGSTLMGHETFEEITAADSTAEKERI